MKIATEFSIEPGTSKNIGGNDDRKNRTRLRPIDRRNTFDSCTIQSVYLHEGKALPVLFLLHKFVQS
ncbi:MAG TPA: hypothetical protein VGI15_04815 [Candidatus Cybelea sp.]